MYLDRDSTGSSGRLIERSQTGPARNNETDRSRRSGSQRLLPQNTAAGQEVVLAPTRLFHGASSTQASSTRSKSVYSQDDTRGSSIRSKSLYSQNDKIQAEGVASDLIDSGYHHQRNESLHVQWTQNDVTRMAGEIYDESIPAVYLSLLGFWICENNANYEMAKAHIRELSLDQVSLRFIPQPSRLLISPLRVTVSIGSIMCTCESCSSLRRVRVLGK